MQLHNNKYARTGHLFQNRYKREVVESEEYLISVLRHIHQNPVKAKMVNHCMNYIWSSYSQHLEYIEVTKYTDEVLKDDLQKEIKILDLKEISMVERNRMIKDIYQSTGASIRQLE